MYMRMSFPTYQVRNFKNMSLFLALLLENSTKSTDSRMTLRFKLTTPDRTLRVASDISQTCPLSNPSPSFSFSLSFHFSFHSSSFSIEIKHYDQFLHLGLVVRRPISASFSCVQKHFCQIIF